MKIGIITFTYGQNFGNKLQNYALLNVLSNIYGNEIYTLKNFDQTTNKNTFDHIKKNTKLLFNLHHERARRKKQKIFDSFSENYLNYYSIPLKINKTDELSDFDAFVCGSDQIWNTMFPNGKDPAFYLDFAPKGSIKASYAASFATEDVLDDWKPQMKDWLHALDYISVRESSGVRIAQELGIIGAVQVLDPVFLLDASTWRNMASERPSYPYLLVYDFDGNKQIAQEAKRLAAQHKLRIVTLQKLPYADRCIRDAGPREFLSLVDGASFVLSNSFHATAFSLIFQRPFMVYDRCENINTRMRDLMVTVGLSHRSSADAPIDWTTVQMRLDKEITASKAYIDSVLQGR